jgi:hypothetical protein
VSGFSRTVRVRLKADTTYVAAAARQAPAGGTREKKTLGEHERLDDLTLIRIGKRHAAVRFGRGPLLLVSVGDRLGRNGAEVKEIDGTRLILEERSTAADGTANLARVVLREGERGGTRYLDRPDEPAPVAVRPVPLLPRKPPAE